MYYIMPIGPSRDKVTSNSEKVKLVALSVIELQLPECIRQAGKQTGRQAGKQADRQLVENPIEYFFKEICNNLLEAFRVI